MKFLVILLLFCASYTTWASWSPAANDLSLTNDGNLGYYPPIINSDGSAMLIIGFNTITAYGRASDSDWNKIGELSASDPMLNYSDFSHPIEASSSMERFATYAGNTITILNYTNSLWSVSEFSLSGDYTSVGDIGISKNGQRIAVFTDLDDGVNPMINVIVVFEDVLGAWVQVGEPIVVGAQAAGRILLDENGDNLTFSSYQSDPSLEYQAIFPVRVFAYANGSWNQKGGNIYPSDDFDMHGKAVQLSSDGQRIAISSPNANGTEGPDMGRVDIYQYDNSNWQLIDSLYGDNPGDAIGYEFCLSSNGNRIAIGTVIHNMDSGHIKVFDYDSITNSYTQVGNDINGSQYEGIGQKFAMSGDGTTIISMNNPYTPQYDENGLNIDTLKTYEYSAPTDESLDTDGDGLTNATELSLGTNPNLVDTDSDGFPDGWEVSRNLDPTVNSSDFINNINGYGYYSTDQIKDLRADSTMIVVENGEATLSMELEQSSDLEIWTSGGTTNLQVPVDPNSDTKFFRFKMAE